MLVRIAPDGQETPASCGGGSGTVPREQAMIRGALASSLLMLLVVGHATAQESGEQAEDKLIEQLDLQTLLNTPVDVWTPSKAPQKSYQAPAIITTVTREQIAVWGYR